MIKKILIASILGSSLFVLAQSVPKAVLLEVGADTATVVATLEGKKWQPTTDSMPESAKPLFTQKNAIKLFTDVGLVGTASLEGQFAEGRCGSEAKITTNTKLSRQIYALVAPWNITPRKVQRLPLNNAAYTKVMAAELAARGIKAPVQMTQILKVDLDGDKSDEIILVAQRPAMTANFELVDSGYALKAHDYALTIVRKLTPSGVKTFVLREASIKTDFDSKKYSEGNGEPPYRFAQWVNGIADFDGDGKMEVLVNSILWEGYGFEVNQWNGKSFAKLFEWGCA